MKTTLTILMTLLYSVLSAQITLSNTYSNQIYLVKLHISGYKYVETDVSNNQIVIYNTNHSVFKTINIPNQTLSIQSVGYVSENLFDLDNDIEYYITTYQGPPVYNQFTIYNEDGTVLFQRDSANLYQTNSDQSYGLYISDPIFYDGISAKMKLQINAGSSSSAYYEVYDLPGSVTCSDCSNGIVSGIITNNNGNKTLENSFYPNPAKDYVRLKYSLPKTFNNAQITVNDLSGKIVETYQITSSFDYIYINDKYSNGMYIFDLMVDGVRISSEKIIIEK